MAMRFVWLHITRVGHKCDWVWYKDRELAMWTHFPGCLGAAHRPAVRQFAVCWGVQDFQENINAWNSLGPVFPLQQLQSLYRCELQMALFCTQAALMGFVWLSEQTDYFPTQQ
jgi:hypothetical protein